MTVCNWEEGSGGNRDLAYGGPAAGGPLETELGVALYRAAKLVDGSVNHGAADGGAVGGYFEVEAAA